jgi:hypothetical protein
MPAPSDKGQKEHVAVRLDASTLGRLEALLPLYALPGRPATRSDGLRAVILAGLVVEEERAARLARASSDADHDRSGGPAGAGGSQPE